MSDTDLPPLLLELSNLGALALLAAAACLGIAALLYRSTLARLWLAQEDPRVMASFRIAFTAMVLTSVNTMAPELTFLFSDEGFYATDVAQSLLARQQFAGYGDGITVGEAQGFFDFRAFVQWLRGPNYSLLLFGSSPTAVWAHLVALDAALLALLFGWRTKYTKWLAWLLYLSLLGRNHAMWAGDEPVIHSLFPLLCVSRCGAAFSLDARRKPRRTPPTIPSWPRYLIIWKVVLIYWAAGICKSGATWASGDAVYYALLFDDLSRWPHHPWLAHIPHLWLQLATWTTLVLELGFPLVLVGLIGRALARNPADGLHRKTRLLLRTFSGLSLVCTGLAVFAYATFYRTMPEPTGESGLWLGQLATVVVYAVIGLVAHLALQRRRLGSALAVRWLFSRRLWLGLSLVLQIQLTLLCNIGMFNPLMCAATLVFFRWPELAAVVRRTAAIVGLRWPHTDVERSGPTTTQHPTPPKLPVAVVWGAAGMIAMAALVQGLRPQAQAEPPVVPLRPFEPMLAFNEGVLLALTFAATIAWRLRRGRRFDGRWLPLHICIAGIALMYDAPQLEATLVGLMALGCSAALACRPGGWAPSQRSPSSAVTTIIATIFMYHACAEAAWLLTRARGEGTQTLRTEIRRTIHPWVRTLNVGFVWRMFSANVRRTNEYLRVLVTDAHGDVYDLRQGIYACLMDPEDEAMCDKVYPRPNWLRERTRKIRRRAIRQDWIARWHSRWVCRDWALRNGGVLPIQVDLVRVSVSMPSPSETASEGLAAPSARLRTHGQQQTIYTALCHEHPTAQLSAEIRRRHGFAPAEAGTIRYWNKQRCPKWSRALGRAGITPSFDCAGAAEHAKIR